MIKGLLLSISPHCLLKYNLKENERDLFNDTFCFFIYKLRLFSYENERERDNPSNKTFISAKMGSVVFV